jgi:hypothetical protein
MLNPLPRIQAIPLWDDHAVYLIDDALAEPTRWVELAAEHAGAFVEEEHNAYPGGELRLPDAITERLVDFFAQHIRCRLGARRVQRAHSRLAIVSLPPERLQPRQWIPHRDRMGLGPEHCIAASVLYLFEDAQLGGTAFFRPTAPEIEIDRLVHDSGVLDAPAFAARYGIAPGYPRGNAWFEHVLTIPPRFNRLIFYDGALFHSSEIPAPQRLSTDPRRGRLTLNGFFTCTRRLGW